MKIQMLAGAAMAALMGMSAPAFAAASPELPTVSYASSASADRAVAAFYAARSGAPLWLAAGNVAAAESLVSVLDRAQLDGLASGPQLANRARALMARAAAGDRAARIEADQLLSTAWVLYVEALQQPTPGMTYADSWSKPRTLSAGQILASAAAAPLLARHVAKVSEVNPVYANLRQAAWSNIQSGGMLDARVLASLDRARETPFQSRYIMVDAASARLYMIEDGRIADSMKVVVGKPGDATQTPMVASTIYFATLNPYWHVTDELVRTLIAKNVLDQGLGYLTSHGYQVFDSYGDDAQKLDPATIDWKAVAAGTQKVEVRQLPGPANSMGELKFGFANKYDIYLHDTPRKEVFEAADRDLSHGCIRLEDAQRLGRWLIGRDPHQVASDQPEQHVALATPVPIYITYMTAQADGGQIAFVDDIYGRDSTALASREVASLR